MASSSSSAMSPRAGGHGHGPDSPRGDGQPGQAGGPQKRTLRPSLSRSPLDLQYLQSRQKMEFLDVLDHSYAGTKKILLIEDAL